MTARSEPLLWVQLISLGVLPLELLLVLLLLAGSDPGPLPGLERLLCWAIGALAPAILLSRRPADIWSLLLVQTPAGGRRPIQHRLSRLQDNLPCRLAAALTAALSLPLLWWLDRHAALAASLAPLDQAPRLVALLLVAALLAVIVWQGQQSVQALWLLSRSAARLSAAVPLSVAELQQSRLSLGLPLLLIAPLQPAPPQPSPAERPRPAQPLPDPVTQQLPEPELPQPAAPEQTSQSPEPQLEQLEQPDQSPQPESDSDVAAVAVEPEQSAEQGEGPELDQQVG